MTAAALVMAVLQSAGSSSPALAKRVRSIAPVILSESRTQKVSPLVIAVLIFKESAFTVHARGARGEVGLMQLHPRGWASTLCRDLQDRWDPRNNIRCGVRIVAWALARCGSVSGALSLYNGSSCRSSVYSRRVMAAVERARRVS